MRSNLKFKRGSKNPNLSQVPHHLLQILHKMMIVLIWQIMMTLEIPLLRKLYLVNNSGDEDDDLDGYGEEQDPDE